MLRCVLGMSWVDCTVQLLSCELMLQPNQNVLCATYYVQDDTPKLADVYSTLSVVYITTINKAVDYIMLYVLFMERMM